MKKIILSLVILFVFGTNIYAQEQKIGFYESELILQEIPEYSGIEQQLDLLSSQWKEEITRLENEITDLQEDYEAKEILYTEDIRKQKRQEIAQKEQQKEMYVAQKFGPNGEYFTRQQALLEPIQRQIFAAVRVVAEEGGYDFVFDRSGDIYMVYARNEFNLQDEILEELGIDTEGQ